MKLAIFDPRHTEANYFTREVLLGLSPIEVQVYGGRGTHPLQFRDDFTNGRGSLPVHHLVDDTSVRVERILLGAIPGVSVVHDTFLSDHGPEPILNSGFSDTVAMVLGDRTNFPERGTEYEREKYFAIRELSLSVLPIFTDPTMHQEFLARSEPRLAVASAYIPWPAIPVNARRSPRNAKPSANNPLRIGVSGGARLGSRVHSLFDALSRLPSPELVHVIWCIRDEKDRVRALALQAEFSRVKIELVSQRTPERWNELLPSLDVAVHLHFGKFERPGPYLPLSLGAGVPCLVSLECSSWLPSEAAFFIRPGSTEVGELLGVFLELVSGMRIGTDVAIDYVRDMHAPAIVQTEFRSLLLRHEHALFERFKSIEGLRNRSKSELLREVSPTPEVTEIFVELGWAEGLQSPHKTRNNGVSI